MNKDLFILMTYLKSQFMVMKNTITRKGMKTIGVIFLIYGILVASHEGEFWPFSIYPMFSQAGNPWTRAMVLDVSEVPDDEIWEIHPLQERYAPAVSVRQYGVDQIDFSNFVSKTENWTASRQQALKNMFGEDVLGQQRWMAAKVQGELVAEDSVVINIVPYFLITEDSISVNPNLPESAYFRGGEQ